MKTSPRFLLTAILAAAALFPASAIAADDPAAQAASSDDQHRTMVGPVQSFNFGPRGIEGIILSTNGTIVQLNLPPELADQIARTVAVGDQIQVTGRIDNGPPPPPPRGPDAMGGPNGGPQDGPGGPGPDAPQRPQSDHPVYRLLTLTDAKGNHYHAQNPQSRKQVRIEGTIKSLNYDRRGMIAGAHLDNGDVVHIGPRESQDLGLAPNMKITVEGMAQTLPGGGQFIDAQSVNGMNVRPRGPGGRDRPRGGPRGGDPDGPGGDGPPPQ
ncbi:MAG: hypothetical protein ACTHN5_15485 [Phycisphaerae bacterium]